MRQDLTGRLWGPVQGGLEIASVEILLQPFPLRARSRDRPMSKHLHLGSPIAYNAGLLKASRPMQAMSILLPPH